MISEGPDTIPLDISIDLRLLAFTFAVAVSTAILFGTIPAIRATNIQFTDALKDGRRPQAAGARKPFARALVVSQVARLARMCSGLSCARLCFWSLSA
jgi:hypothetical protein